MSRRGTLLLIAVLAVLGGVVAAVVALVDDGGGPSDGAAPPGPGVVACDGPPTLAVSVDVGMDAPAVFVARPGEEPTPVLPGAVTLDAAPAPGGRGVAVTVADGDYESGGPSGSSLTVVGLDGTDPRALTPPTLAVEDQAPAWSPDGATIAFVRSDYTDPEVAGWSLLTVPAAGGEPTEVVASEGRLVRVDSPAWSPDGTQLAFTRSVDQIDGSATTTSVWLVDAAGSGARELAPLPDWAVLDWSDDGTHLLAGAPRYGGDVPASVVDVASGAVTTVEGAPGGTRWSSRAGRVIGVDTDGSVVEQVLDDGALGDVEVLLAQADLPPSTFEGDPSPGWPWDVAVVPCRR